MDDYDSPPDLKALKNLIIHLDEKDLVMFNKLIVERIKLVRAENKAQIMAAFEVGDAVFFHNKQNVRVDAKVLRLNKKTLSLISDDGERWNVAPELCELNNPRIGDLFEADSPYNTTNVAMLPGTSAAQTAGSGRWYGGVVEMSAYVSEDGESYRPLVLMWIDADGMITASDICPPGVDLKPLAFETLQQAMRSPMTGKPQRPKYITVNDRDLADYLASRVSGINIEYGDTPILNDVIDNMQNMMPPGEPSETYLSTGLSAAQISSFFDAAAGLYHSAPWEHVPHDACLLSVTIKSLGIQNAVLSVIGQMGESFGVILFADFQTYSQYQIAIDCMRHGVDCDVPPHTALSFDEGAEVATSIRREVAEHGWQVPNASSYPVLFTPDRDNMQRPLSAADIALFDALSRALPVVLKNHKKLLQAWNAEEVLHKNINVDSMGDQVAVDIVAPYPFELAFASKDPTDTTMIRLALLAHIADEPNREYHGELCDNLLDLFLESPEAKKRSDGPEIVTLLLQFAFDFQSATIATLQAGALEEIIFEIIPHKVMLPPSAAKGVIEDCRLFYRFLKRQYGLPQADLCLKVLGGSAIKRLKAALADDTGFGMGKAAISDAMLDFDPESLPPELLFDHGGLPGTAKATKPKPPDAREKKKRRKATKKSRKKNR